MVSVGTVMLISPLDGWMTVIVVLVGVRVCCGVICWVGVSVGGVSSGGAHVSGVGLSSCVGSHCSSQVCPKAGDLSACSYGCH